MPAPNQADAVNQPGVAREDTACTAFERLFRARGLPFATRSDNGVPFASPNALFNLKTLGTAFGAQASCTMISDTSTWSRKPWCYPSVRAGQFGNWRRGRDSNPR
jgi:hypothetical protein